MILFQVELSQGGGQLLLVDGQGTQDVGFSTLELPGNSGQEGILRPRTFQKLLTSEDQFVVIVDQGVYGILLQADLDRQELIVIPAYHGLPEHFAEGYLGL